MGTGEQNGSRRKGRIYGGHCSQNQEQEIGCHGAQSADLDVQASLYLTTES